MTRTYADIGAAVIGHAAALHLHRLRAAIGRGEAPAPMHALPEHEAQALVPRQIAAYLSREETDASLVRIGGALGGRDHSTIIHGCAKIEREMGYDAELRREVALLREALLRLGQGSASRQ